MTLSVNDFTAGDVITASAMNTNFATIEGYVNSSPGLAQLTGATFSGTVTFSAGLTSTGGTTALGVTNITGNVNVGTDGSGHDVVFHSATASDKFHWDASDEILKITGTHGQNALSILDGNVYIADTLDVDGTTNLDVVDIDGTVNMAADLTLNAQVLGSNSVPIVYYSHSGAAGSAQKVNDTPQIFVCTSTPSFGLDDGDIWFDIS